MRPRGRRSAVAGLIAALCALTPLRSQTPARGAEADAAAAILAARTPETDDTDARVDQLIAAAKANPRSPIAELLLQNVAGQLDELDEPARAITALGQFLAQDVYPLARQAAERALRALLLESGDREAAATIDPEAGSATEFLCVGPFGDEGDHFLDAVFPPDLAFPAPGTLLRGRYGPTSPYPVARRPREVEVSLRRASDPRSGCYYALHQFESDRARGAYVEITCASAWRARLNGAPIAEVRRPAARAPRRIFVAVRLRQGVNQLVLKTGLEDESRAGLRYVDALGAPLSGVRELPADRIAALGDPVPDDLPQPAPFVDGLMALARRAHDGEGVLIPTFAIVTALEALRIGDADRAGAILFAQSDSGPADPRLALGLAEAWRNCPDLPRELRDATVRRLTERAADALPRHWFAQVSRIDALRTEDRLEDAAHLLAELVRNGDAGRATFARLVAVERALGDLGTAERSLARWLDAHPRDEDARAEIARMRSERGDRRGALEVLLEGLRVAPGQASLLRLTRGLATDLGEREVALAAIDTLRAADRDSVSARMERADALRDLGDLDSARALEKGVADDGDVDPSSLRRLATLAWRDEDVALARGLLQRFIARTPSSAIAERRTLARLDGASEDFPRIARFLTREQEVDAMVANYHPTARDQGAPSTVLIDRMVVEMLEDGGRVEVVQQLRRINDLSGVQAHENAQGAANADEVLRLRTIAADGQSYVPQKVKGEFAMPRVEPGAFVDELWRRHFDAPTGGPWRGPAFWFQSADEPFVHTEFVVILPPRARGELRTRGITTPAESIDLGDGYIALRIARDDVPRLRTERATPPIDELVPSAAFGEDGSYASQARLIGAAAPIRARVTPPILAATSRVIDGIDGEGARIAAIHAFVHERIGVEANADATATLLRGQGSRFFLEAAMLQAAGLELRQAAARATVDELSEGPHALFLCQDTPQVPAVQVLPRDSAPLWLFADTPRFAPVGFIPAERAGAAVLFADSGALGRLPRGDERASGWTAQGSFDLDDDGNGELDVDLTLRDAQGYQFAQQVRDLDRNRRGLVARNIGARLLPGWTLRSAEIRDPKPGTTFGVHLRAVRRGAIQTAGDRRVLALPMPPTELFARLGDQAGRTLPLRVDVLSIDAWRVVVRPGAHWRITAVPSGLCADNVAIDFALRFAPEGENLDIERRVAFRPTTIQAAAFDQWVRFLRAIDRAEDERVVVTAR